MPDDLKTLEELRVRVMQLRPVLLGGLKTDGYLNLFDEFVREWEPDLALHCVCDYLLEPETVTLDGATIEEVCSIHLSMDLRDDCVERLRTKRAGQNDSTYDRS
jgi:hypothetical protein